MTDAKLTDLIEGNSESGITPQQVHLALCELRVARKVVEVAREVCCVADGLGFCVDTYGHEKLEDTLTAYDHTMIALY